MLEPRISRFSFTNPETCFIATARLRSDAASSVRSPASISETDASDWLNRRTVESLRASVRISPSRASRRAEQLLLVVVEGAGELAEVLDGLVELGPLPAEVRRRGLEQVGERTLGVGAVGTEGDGQVVEALVDLVELERYGGAVGLQRRTVVQHRSVGPDGGELDEAVADDRRRHDDGLGVLGDLDLRVVRHRHGHVGARRRHGVDGPDRHAEDADVAALVDRDGPREVGGEGLALLAAEEREGRRDEQRDHDGGDDQLPGGSCQPTCGTGGRFWM